MLNRPNYIEMEGGAISKVFCQVCGEQIAGLVPGAKGSGPYINKLVEKFRRFPNYAEIKMEMDDGSMHVTNGCKTCMKMDMPKSQMLEIYKADMVVMGMKSKKVPEKIVAVDTTGSGLL